MELFSKQEMDQTYAVLVKMLVHTGLTGLILAALFGAIQSTIDSVLNSTSTIITLDLYKKFIRPGAREDSLARMGKWISAAVLIIAALIVKSQLRYMGNLDVGYSKDQIVVIRLHDNKLNNFGALKSEIKAYPRILEASISDALPNNIQSQVSPDWPGMPSSWR